jgi:hypothetical protein
VSLREYSFCGSSREDLIWDRPGVNRVAMGGWWKDGRRWNPQSEEVNDRLASIWERTVRGGFHARSGRVPQVAQRRTGVRMSGGCKGKTGSQLWD